MEHSRVFRQIEAFRQEMLDVLMQIIRTPAIGPESNGVGESHKAELLSRILNEIGFDKLQHFNAVDLRVPSGKRPNIVAYLNGKDIKRRLWIVTHMDVVPPGEESLWKVTKPFEPIIRDNCVFGRGSEDNGQSLVASIFAAKALTKLGEKPKRTLALAFVSDEEQGSTMGIQYLIKEGVFHKDDLIVVPDSGNSSGSFIEITEKNILWFKMVVTGKQAHGSEPQKGLNAHRIGMQVALSLDEILHKKYNENNEFFTPPSSTFEPTRKDKNVDAVNIVPGEDVIYFDCRILPQYNVEEVISEVKKVTERYERKTGAIINIDVLQKQSAPFMKESIPEIAILLRKALKQIRGLEASFGGIGGGTCAAFFRKAGIPAVVWSTVDEVAHQADEYAKVSNLIEDAKVFALLSLM